MYGRVGKGQNGDVSMPKPHRFEQFYRGEVRGLDDSQGMSRRRETWLGFYMTLKGIRHGFRCPIK